MNKNNQQYRDACAIVSKLRAEGYEALFAGGSVRDYLLKNGKSSDIDIATNARPSTIRSLFKQVVPVGETFGVMVVVRHGKPFEVATFRSDIGIADGRHPEHVVFTDARTDALRRDFTINGMFYDPLTDGVIDYVNGQEDLQNGIIRAIGEPVLRFNEDYLRMLRAVRFAARFEFTVETETWNALLNKAAEIKRISVERIFSELNKMLTAPHPDRAVRLLHEAGLLAAILPEVAALEGVEQPAQFHPEGDVLIHTLITLSELQFPTSAAAWSALLHDIGKPATMTRSDRIRFNNHSRVGAAMAKKILHRLKAPRSLISEVTAIIDNHMNFIHVQDMRTATLKKFLSRPTLQDELNLHRADCLASHGDVSNVSFLSEKLNTFRAEQLKPQPFLSGRDLITAGLEPGPLFGHILDELYELQLEDKVTSREEALQWVTRHYPGTSGEE